MIAVALPDACAIARGLPKAPVVGMPVYARALDGSSRRRVAFGVGAASKPRESEYDDSIRHDVSLVGKAIKWF